jgi:hypothetical protein
MTKEHSGCQIYNDTSRTHPRLKPQQTPFERRRERRPPMLRAAARRSAALAPAARRVHAQSRAPKSSAPVRQGMDPKWIPLFKRLMRLGRGSTPGAGTAELTEWVRANRPVSQVQIVAYVRTIRSFNNSCALEVRPPQSLTRRRCENCWPNFWIGMSLRLVLPVEWELRLLNCLHYQSPQRDCI